MGYSGQMWASKESPRSSLRDDKENKIDSDSDLMANHNTIVANGNLDANGYGQVRGTNLLEVDAYDGY